MADKLELKEETKAKKPWGFKKVLTTVIIAILALLMIGGAYYIVVLAQDATDDTYVFGTYNGEKIKYEPGTEFYNRLAADQNYVTAVQNGDYSSMYASWQTAYQYQVLMTAGNQKAKQAKITAPEELVNDAIIESGAYASADGSSTFDAEVYKNAAPASRDAYYNYMEERLPYAIMANDLYSVYNSDAEKQFVKDMAKDTRSFDYFEINYDAYPEDLALSYDISAMPKATDEDGNEVEPSLSEIRAFIYAENPDEVKPYIQDKYESAKALADSDFESASTYGNDIVNVQDVMNNIGQASFFINEINYADMNGALASIYSEDTAKQLFTAKEGTVLSFPTEDGYVFVKVASDAKNDALQEYTGIVFDSYAPNTTYMDFANEVFTSENFKDDFYAKFLNVLFGSSSVAN